MIKQKHYCHNESFSPELAAPIPSRTVPKAGIGATVREGWVRSRCGAHGGRNTLRCPGPSRVITPILASQRIFLMRKVYCHDLLTWLLFFAETQI